MLVQDIFGSQWYFWRLQSVRLIFLDFLFNCGVYFEVEIIFTLLHWIFFLNTKLINQITVSYARDGSLAAEKSLGFFAAFPGVKVGILGRTTHMVKSGLCCSSWKFSPRSQFAPT